MLVTKDVVVVVVIDGDSEWQLLLALLLVVTTGVVVGHKRCCCCCCWRQWQLQSVLLVLLATHLATLGHTWPNSVTVGAMMFLFWCQVLLLLVATVFFSPSLSCVCWFEFCGVSQQINPSRNLKKKLVGVVALVGIVVGVGPWAMLLQIVVAAVVGIDC
jgi:hypothetical protein